MNGLKRQNRGKKYQDYFYMYNNRHTPDQFDQNNAGNFFQRRHRQFYLDT